MCPPNPGYPWLLTPTLILPQASALDEVRALGTALGECAVAADLAVLAALRRSHAAALARPSGSGGGSGLRGAGHSRSRSLDAHRRAACQDEHRFGACLQVSASHRTCCGMHA